MILQKKSKVKRKFGIDKYQRSVCVSKPEIQKKQAKKRRVARSNNS